MTSSIEIHLHYDSGEQQTLTVEIGQSLMEAAVIEGVTGIQAECGGAPQCGTCSVIVDEAWTAEAGAPSDLEVGILSLHDKLHERCRLTCQMVAEPNWHGLKIHVPSSQY